MRSLFGTSGIRGKVGEELSPESCLEIGKAIGSTLPIASEACLATDTRVSSSAITSAVVSGLLSVGINVTELGILPTPALALLTRELGFDAGIMVTASHNPPCYNGIKLFAKDSLGFSVEQQRTIESRYTAKQFRHASWQEYGCLDKRDKAEEEYLLVMKEKVSSWEITPRMRLVIDPGNGAACNLAPTFFRSLGFDIFPINNEPNGLFPGRGAEPTAEALGTTVTFLNECDADLAICWDGDADRVVFCDKQGFLGYDQMIAFISRLAVLDSGKNKVATTVEAGRILDAAVADLGAEVFRSKVGDIAVAHAVRELNAAIGVEPVGVYILPEIGYYPDSFLAALFLLRHLQDIKEIRDFHSRLPVLFFQNSKIPYPDDLRPDVERVYQVAASSFKNGKVTTLDGIRIDFADSWLLIRASGTEPVIRVLVEATSERKVKKLMAQSSNLVRQTITQAGDKI